MLRVHLVSFTGVCAGAVLGKASELKTEANAFKRTAGHFAGNSGPPVAPACEGNELSAACDILL